MPGGTSEGCTGFPSNEIGMLLIDLHNLRIELQILPQTSCKFGDDAMIQCHRRRGRIYILWWGSRYGERKPREGRKRLDEYQHCQSKI